LPTRYAEHRFYVEPVTLDGTKLEFFTDTGGGLFILSEAAERLGLPVANLGGEGEERFLVTVLPEFRPEAWIPLPLARQGRIPLWSPSAGEQASSKFTSDGMLGQDWFGGRTWTFDYPGRGLLLHPEGEVVEENAEHTVSLGFKTGDDGQRELNFPRIEVDVDGVTLDLLFDTGATTFLTADALTALKDGGAAERATSFITASTFEEWKRKHPGWRVIEEAETTTGEPMIEVPSLTVAGHTVGPVWFTRRPDKNFHEFMSRFMDRKVEGALGGNSLRSFRVTVDYPRALAVFKK
jgi:hypothetical protein